MTSLINENNELNNNNKKIIIYGKIDFDKIKEIFNVEIDVLNHTIKNHIIKSLKYMLIRFIIYTSYTSS